jgi:alanine racemase
VTRPARVVIDTDAARHNLARARALAPQQRIMAIIKADGYGHGLVRMASAFAAADAYGVACLEEARTLRDAVVERPIVLLEGPFAAAEIAEIAECGFETVIHCFEQIRYLESARIKKQLRVWVKIDTGMHRLGFPTADLAEARKRLMACSCVHPPLRVMSHFASAHDPAEASVDEQLSRFEAETADWAGERSLANSAALLSRRDTLAEWVRPGLMLYGISPFAGENGVDRDLRPVMELRSRLISVKQVSAGATVGYGGDWRAERDTTIGIVAMGYGDGYPRHAPSGTPVLIKGKRARLAGRISMDMLAVDLHGIDAPAVGDPVVLWGPELPVEVIAEYADTAPYELLCGVPALRAHYQDAKESV